MAHRTNKMLILICHILGGRYIGSDEYAALRSEARRDEHSDYVEEHGWTCQDCGEMWDPGHVPATRVQPAEVRKDSCPSCGGDPVCDGFDLPVTGRITTE